MAVEYQWRFLKFGGGHEELKKWRKYLQAEGLESLEWLSHFMDDSISDYSLTGKLPDAAAAAAKKQPCFTTPVQTKARTKRARAGPPVWHVLSSTEQSSSPPSSTSSTASFPQSDSPPESAPAKKKRKTSAAAGGGSAQPRKCSHCGVTKTPQWRAGPLGAKTLCNACGVRYKSGRLLPEYRPACSPTFSTEIHSNNHRKVLEMRQKKETKVPAAGLPPPVRSF